MVNQLSFNGFKEMLFPRKNLEQASRGQQENLILKKPNRKINKSPHSQNLLQVMNLN